MKKTAKILLIGSAAVMALTLIPWLIRILSMKPERTPFTLYSCVLHDFTGLYNDSRDFTFVDSEGNSWGDEVQPLFYASILASKGQLPDSLEGRPVTLDEIERNNLYITLDPKDVNAVKPPVYLLMESVPLRLELQDAEEAIVSRKDGLYIYEMDSDSLLLEKSQRLNADLKENGFVFPAKRFAGNPTDRKDHDEGYLVTDSASKLYQIKQVNGEIQVRHFPKADTLAVSHMIITEFENHATLGILVSGNGRMAVLRPSGEVLVTEVPFDPTKEDLLIIGDMFYYTVKTSTSKGEHFYALSADDFSLKATMDRPYETKTPLYGITFTSAEDLRVYPRFKNTNN